MRHHDVMSNRPSRHRGVILPVASVACLAGFVVWLTFDISRSGLGNGSQIAGIVSMYVTIAAFLVAVPAAIASGRNPDTGKMPTTDELDSAAEALAMAVRGNLETEERVRRIHDPFPLPVRWRAAPAVLMDHWQSIHGSAGKHDAIHLAGSGDDISELFLKLPSRRLVVLGRAGAGKTIVVSRFVLALLDRRAADGTLPVPVPLSAGSWDPAVPLRSWAASQLAQDHPFLGQRDEQGVMLGQRMLGTRHVMLVLDGFDEIGAEQQPEAIKQINAALGRGDWLLVTSRHEEYAAAVEKSDVITSAAVIQLRDLAAADVAAYLPLTTRKEQQGTTRTKWQPAVTRLLRPGGSAAATALRAVLVTPLMVALARVAYSDTQADPADLVADPPGSRSLVHPGNPGGSETWEDSGPWWHRRSIRMSCVNAR
jgi:NACHT domain